MSGHDGDFATGWVALRFDTKRYEDKPARWHLMGRDGRGYEIHLEQDLGSDRALEIARLLGVEAEALLAMRQEATRLRERAADRLRRTHDARVEAEAQAVRERREAERLRKEVRRLESPDAAH